MRTQHVHTATSQSRGALLHDFVSFHFVDCIGQRVRAQGKVFAHRFRQVWSVGGNTAGKNKSSYDGFITISFGDSLHYSGRTGHIDLPHAVEIEHTGTDGIQHKSQVDYGDRAGFPQQKKQLAAGFFETKIHSHEAVPMVAVGRIQIYTDNLGMRQ
jgi:hypothetical protein